MAQHIAGWILLVVGVGFLIAGMIGAFKAVLAQQTKVHRDAMALNLSIPALPGFADLIKALLKQKGWGPIAALGLLLAVFGAVLISTGHGASSPPVVHHPVHHHHPHHRHAG